MRSSALRSPQRKAAPENGVAPPQFLGLAAEEVCKLTVLSAKLALGGVYFRSSGSKTRRAPLSIGHKYPALKTRVGGSSWELLGYGTSCSSDIDLTLSAASCVFPEARTKLARRKTNDVEGTPLGNCGAVDTWCASKLTGSGVPAITPRLRRGRRSIRLVASKYADSRPWSLCRPSITTLLSRVFMM